MKAIIIQEWGEPSASFLFEEVDEPNPGPGEVRIAVHTAAINFGDTLIAAGRYQVRPDFPFTPSAEGSGVIDAVGDGVVEYNVGDRVAVMGFIGNARADRKITGFCREKAITSLRNVTRVPDNVGLEQAALFRSNTETSYYGLQQANLKSGETLLVMGAGGGTGSAAVALGKMMGARVIASATSEEKRAIALVAGADIAIDSHATDWRGQVESFAQGGVDVIYDPVGGDQSERAFRTLRYGGRHLVIGFASGPIPKLPLNLPLLKASSVVGANLLLGWEAEPQRIEENARFLMSALSEGKLSVPPVSRRYPLERASDAFQEVAEGKVAGRIVIAVGPQE